MSSHHIVRENQEPALLVEDFDAVSTEILGQLLEWSPTILTGLYGFYQAITSGIKVDYLILDAEEQSLEEQILHDLPTGTHLISGIASFYENAYQVLQSLGNRQVNIISTHMTPSFFESWRIKVNPVVFWKDRRYTFVETGYSKWKPKDSLVYLLQPPEDLRIQGLHMNAKDNRAFLCIEDGLVVFEFEKQPFLIIGEEL